MNWLILTSRFAVDVLVNTRRLILGISSSAPFIHTRQRDISSRLVQSEIVLQDWPDELLCESARLLDLRMLSIGIVLLPPPRVLFLAMETTINCTSLPFLFFLFRQEEVVISQIARLFPQFPHLGVSRFSRDGPDALSKPFVPLAILFDALLDLFLVKAVM